MCGNEECDSLLIKEQTEQTKKKFIMNKIIFIALLVGGVVLMILGVQPTNSFSSDVPGFFTGSSTNKAICMLIGGVVAGVDGTGLRMIESTDRKHLGRTQMTFMDGHAESRPLKKERTGWKQIFNPLDPVAAY
jgi:prepilin-type processing-associated H-X9-DG protein